MSSLTTTYICAYPGCGKQFNSQQALAAHEGSHKNQGEYPCPECLANGLTITYNRPQALGTHRFHAHGVPSGKPGKHKHRQPKPKPDRLHVSHKQPAEPEPGSGAEPEPERQLPAPVPADRSADNGNPGDVVELIETSMQPLIDRYTAGMTWLQEVAEEEARLIVELGHLWQILKVLPPGTLQPPPGTEGKVTVEYSQGVGQVLHDRGEEWLRSRTRSFDVPTMARGLGVHASSVNRLIEVMRTEGKIRLTGKRGHARIYTSTISADDAE
jgi:hypothetical protein